MGKFKSQTVKASPSAYNFGVGLALAHDAAKWSVGRVGHNWVVSTPEGQAIQFPIGSGDTEADAIRYAKRKLGREGEDAGFPSQVSTKPQDLKAGQEFYRRMQGNSTPGQRGAYKEVQDLVNQLMDDYTVQFDEDEDGYVKDVHLTRRGTDEIDPKYDLRNPTTPEDIQEAHRRGLISTEDRNARMAKHGGMRAPTKDEGVKVYRGYEIDGSGPYYVYKVGSNSIIATAASVPEAKSFIDSENARAKDAFDPENEERKVAPKPAPTNVLKGSPPPAKGSGERLRSMDEGVRTEAGLKDNEPRLVTGWKGSQRFTERFANAGEMDRWLNANPDADDYSVRRMAMDANPQEIDAYYKQLKGMERSALEKLVGGRLDPSHLKSESKSNLINAALNAKFSRSDLDAWGK